MDEAGIKDPRQSRKCSKSIVDQVACASFDYMKLMVVEMQQQLNELEDRERIGGGEGGDPKPPPRGRANPFNSGGEVCFCKLFGIFRHLPLIFSSRGGR